MPMPIPEAMSTRTTRLGRRVEARRFIETARGDITASMVMSESGISRSNANLLLWQLQREGRLDKVARGVYRATRSRAA